MQHDVFLIFNNAMHFNSAGTIFFRQVCYIVLATYLLSYLELLTKKSLIPSDHMILLPVHFAGPCHK